MNLDPIVITPKKKLDVPDFSKKQIEKIAERVAAELVGKIQSGTKLYRHHTVMENIDTSITWTIDFISVSPTKMQGYNITAITKDNMISGYVERNDFFALVMGENLTSIYCINTASGEFNALSFDIGITDNVISDTVTEL